MVAVMRKVLSAALSVVFVLILTSGGPAQAQSAVEYGNVVGQKKPESPVNGQPAGPAVQSPSKPQKGKVKSNRPHKTSQTHRVHKTKNGPKGSRRKASAVS